ncbi:hypothetical protein [Minwuia thermotolerans]|uniref:Copper resistance protein D domain-containing protein n=1 Tax=Minwuia thermotolerans TaxID=2056226 RepID=A0A2M9G394_9PROT|nr:hypothetical protein [Minwuia thermotolerans]PJK30178.1 hypothetical protein CVT23_07190 [Minwuia thermotolerans]
MDDLTIARAIHVLAVVHWIGGVFMVTAVILPAVRRFAEPSRRMELFEAVEGRFSAQAKISVALAGLSGFWMTWRLDAWHRFAEAGFWWMHAMFAVWLVFAVVLFVAEPLFLHDWFRRRARTAPEATMALVQRFHWTLLTVSLIATAAAVLGAHGTI